MLNRTFWYKVDVKLNIKIKKRRKLEKNFDSRYSLNFSEFFQALLLIDDWKSGATFLVLQKLLEKYHPGWLCVIKLTLNVTFFSSEIENYRFRDKVHGTVHATLHLRYLIGVRNWKYLPGNIQTNSSDICIWKLLRTFFST